MAGTWSGEGRVILTDGQTERVRCRASSQVGGDGVSMRQSLRCASPSYSFDVQNTVAAQGSRVSGSWAETTHNVLGNVSGTVSGETVRVRVQAGQFAADVTLVTAGNTLRVTLIPYGTHVREVSIQMRRG